MDICPRYEGSGRRWAEVVSLECDCGALRAIAEREDGPWAAASGEIDQREYRTLVDGPDTVGVPADGLHGDFDATATDACDPQPAISEERDARERIIEGGATPSDRTKGILEFVELMVLR